MLVLASQSPRRKALLSSAGIEFVARPVEVPEERLAGEEARKYVLRLAQAKAEAVAVAPGEIILAADTVVVVGDHILEKPENEEHARWMLGQLSGREHEVITGICLRSLSRRVVDAETTRVRFVPMSEREIARYVESGEPMDKAGAYGAQGLASKFIDRIEGCYFNVVGLPVALVYRHLKQWQASG